METSVGISSSELVQVTVENFVRAETDNYMKRFVDISALRTFYHNRTPTPIDQQNVVRMNRDTLYSEGVFDLETSPVTVTLPDPGKRFMSMQVINQDHYALEVVYEPGSYTFTKTEVGTRYLVLLIRILVDPNDVKDVEAVHALQNAITFEQQESGRFEVPNWDAESLSEVRDALKMLANHLTAFDRAFGRKDEVDPIQHLIGTAAGWGGNPRSDAFYIGVNPKSNDGKTVHRLTVKDVPVDGFWSISVYNQDGFFEKNPQDVYSINNLTAERNEDRSVTVQFGGCEEESPNCLPITPGWNYMVRMYRPRPEILDGSWTFPTAEPV